MGRSLLAFTLALATALGPRAAGAQQGNGGAVAERGSASIRPGDIVRLTVSRHADLTGDFPVSEFGTVTIPKLGEIDVSAETHRSLRERVLRELRQTVVSPAIELTVMMRVRVLGEVMQPGLFHVDPTMTVADALALAGGWTPEASRGTVILRRGGETVVADLRTLTPVSESPIRSGDELEAVQRSWFSRNGLTLVTSAAGIVSVILALAFK
jgi:polysaccharide export outer membrane protein